MEKSFKQFTDKALLDLAKGVTPEKEELSEDAEFLFKQEEWAAPPARKRELYTKRKKVRHTLFKIIKKSKNGTDLTPSERALKSLFDPQMNGDLAITWATFTFNWDVSPDNHLQVIRKDEWFTKGGRYDELGALYPTAFTEQEM